MLLLHPPKLLTADEYAKDLAKTIAESTNEIVVTVTTFRDDDSRSHEIVEELCKAADRGVAVSVCVDTFTYLEPKEFLLRSPKRQPARAVRAIQLERKLKHHGVMFRWLGRKASAIIYGRTHSKWAVVDDTVYSFGGVNMDNESFENTDFMLRFVDAKLAASILAEHLQVRRADKGGGAFRSHKFALDAHSTVLFDGGLVADSLIYRRAYQLSQEAESILCVSQYCPTGKLARSLKKKGAQLYFNHWRNASLVNRFLISFSSFSAKNATRYSQSNYLHAKFMLFTMPGGEKVIITGSHNFMYGSGLVGTREIALETSDKHIIKQIESFFAEYIG